jgi:glycosyltransferase involved in cell wall biosynthesis
LDPNGGILDFDERRAAGCAEVDARYFARISQSPGSDGTMTQDLLMFSVVVCTRDRVADLERCLQSLRAQRYDDFEVIVVDDAPRDQSAADLASRFGARYLLQSSPGVSAARNRGARAAHGQIVAFIDDDAVAAPDWLLALAKAFQDASITGVAGRILPLESASPGNPPIPSPWEPGFGERVIDSSSPDWFQVLNFGCVANASNMAIRRHAFNTWGIDERFGRGRALHSFADHNAFFTLVAKGHRVLYWPDAIVHHPALMPPEAARQKELKGFSAAAGYMLLLWMEWPQYRKQVARIAARWIFRGHDHSRVDVRRYRNVSRMVQLLYALRGPLLYWRTRREPKPRIEVWPTSAAIESSLPKVTIAIPTFNRAGYLGKALDSALGQSYANIQVIVSDNASTDATQQVLAAYDDRRLTVLRQERNLGMVPNWNACLEAAEGEFFLFLSDDDYLAKTAIERMMHVMHPVGAQGRSDGIGFVYGVTVTVDKHGRELRVGRCGPGLESVKSYILGVLRYHREIYPCSTLLRTADLRELGGYPGSRLPFAADAFVWAACGFKRGMVACIQEPVAYYRVHPSNATKDLGLLRWIDDVNQLSRSWSRSLQEASDTKTATAVQRATPYYIARGIAATLTYSARMNPSSRFLVLWQYLRLRRHFSRLGLVPVLGSGLARLFLPDVLENWLRVRVFRPSSTTAQV